MSEHEHEIEDDGPEIEAEAEVVAPDPDTESEARKYGWKPKEEFTRDPEGWVDASRFMELPSTHAKMLRDQKRELERERAELKDQLSRIGQASEEAIERMRAQERAAYEARLAHARNEARQAVENADVEAFDRAQQREAELLRQAPRQPQPAPANDLPDWAKDREMLGFAVNAIEQTPGIKHLTRERQIAWAERQVRSVFPEKFEAPAPQTPAQTVSRVDGGGLAGGLKRGKSEADLPPEAKDAGMRFVAKGVFPNLGEYAKSYWKNA